jgi:hypothetical protein
MGMLLLDNEGRSFLAMLVRILKPYVGKDVARTFFEFGLRMGILPHALPTPLLPPLPVPHIPQPAA